MKANAASGETRVPELRVLSIDGMKPALTRLAPQIERLMGCRLLLNLRPDTSEELVEQITRGDAFDVAILTAAMLDDMIKRGKIAAATRVELGRCGVGVGIRAGTPKPDISTPEAAKRALLSAGFVSFHATGNTADRIHKIFERLGIAQEMKPKLLLDAVSRAGSQKKVAEGRADLMLGLTSEVNDAGHGLELVGPLPDELQSNYARFAGGVAIDSRAAGNAQALLRFITTPAAVPTLNALGIYQH